MPPSGSRSKAKKNASPLMVRLDEASKQSLAEAARLRNLSVSDYVRTVTVAQAKREVLAAKTHLIALTPEEQDLLWAILDQPAAPTAAQKRLGAIMRGDK